MATKKTFINPLTRSSEEELHVPISSEETPPAHIQQQESPPLININLYESEETRHLRRRTNALPAG